MGVPNPVGSSVSEARSRRARRSTEYRAEADRVAPYEQLARMIIRLRMDHSLTQEELARRVGTSKAAISRLESGQHAPTAESLRRIAEAFGGHLLIGLEIPGSDEQQVLARIS